MEERTLKFAKNVVEFTKSLPKSLANIEIIKQLVRTAGSVGANYIEANESLSKKDFTMRIKICRKEAKESRYWLKLVEVGTQDGQRKRELLIEESTQLIEGKQDRGQIFPLDTRQRSLFFPFSSMRVTFKIHFTNPTK